MTFEYGHSKEQMLESACELVRKFGFVPRSVIWRHLTSSSRASKFRAWKYLSGRPEFSSYQSGLRSNYHLVLSNGYRKFLGEGGAVSVRPAIYFRHDEYLMDLILHLKAADLISEFWTEQELKMDPVFAVRTVGAASDVKIPDLVLDLKGTAGPVRIAVEVERTLKSQRRYRLIQLTYSRLRRIDVLLYGVDAHPTERMIQGVFSQGGSKLAFGFFNLDELLTAGLRTQLRIRGKTIELGEFFLRLSGRAEHLRQSRDKAEIRVSPDEPSGAAA